MIGQSRVLYYVYAQTSHGYALLITAVIFVDITSAILPLTSEYSFSLVRVRDLGLGLGLG